MDNDHPRFEFRVWGDRLAAVCDHLISVGESCGTMRSIEIYFVSRFTTDANPKARDDLLDVKVLAGVHDGFEQWRVQLKAEFPVATTDLQADFFPLLGIEPPALAGERYSLGRLRSQVVARIPDLAAVEVRKTRRLFTVAGCRAEFTEAVLGDRRLETVAVEAIDPGAVDGARRELGLSDRENVSYPRAIRRVLGWDGAPVGD